MENKKQKPELERIADLQAQNHRLEAELASLDKLLKAVGFEEGVTSLRAAALEVLSFNKEG